MLLSCGRGLCLLLLNTLEAEAFLLSHDLGLCPALAKSHTEFLADHGLLRAEAVTETFDLLTAQVLIGNLFRLGKSGRIFGFGRQELLVHEFELFLGQVSVRVRIGRGGRPRCRGSPADNVGMYRGRLRLLCGRVPVSGRALCGRRWKNGCGHVGLGSRSCSRRPARTPWGWRYLGKVAANPVGSVLEMGLAPTVLSTQFTANIRFADHPHW